MSTGKLARIAIVALIVIAAIIVCTAAITLIFPDLPVLLKDSGVQNIALVNWRHILPATGAGSIAPTPLPGIDDYNNSSLANSTWALKYDTPDFNAKGNDVEIEVLNLTQEGINRTE